METKKIVIHSVTNTSGTDSWEFIEVPADMPDNDLYELAWQFAVENAETYGIYPPSDNEDDDIEAEPDDSIEGIWYIYDPKLHNRYTHNGTPSWHSVYKYLVGFSYPIALA